MTDNLNTLPTGDVGALVERLRGHKCPECKGWGEVAYFGGLVACKCNGHYEAPIMMATREQAAATILALTAEVERVRAVATGDHKRGCQGREYTCTCGFDDALAAALSAHLEPVEVTCWSCDGTRCDLYDGNPDKDCTVCNGRGEMTVYTLAGDA